MPATPESASLVGGLLTLVIMRSMTHMLLGTTVDSVIVPDGVMSRVPSVEPACALTVNVSPVHALLFTVSPAPVAAMVSTPGSGPTHGKLEVSHAGVYRILLIVIDASELLTILYVMG